MQSRIPRTRLGRLASQGWTRDIIPLQYTTCTYFDVRCGTEQNSCVVGTTVRYHNCLVLDESLLATRNCP